MVLLAGCKQGAKNAAGICQANLPHWPPKRKMKIWLWGDYGTLGHTLKNSFRNSFS